MGPFNQEDLILRISKFMKERNLEELKGSARALIWQELCSNLNNSLSQNQLFSYQVRLHKLWNAPNSYIKRTVMSALASNNSNRHIFDKSSCKLQVKITNEEWQDQMKTAMNHSKSSFLVKFDNFLSAKLQNLGIKCWLRSSHNRFKKNVLWEGIYKCIEKNCEIEKFECIAFKTINEVLIDVKFCDKIVTHEKLIKRLRISGQDRVIQQYSLSANGIANTQSFNAIYNANINDPSKTNYSVKKKT